MLILPEHAHQNLLWCIFCNCDILELDSPFAWSVLSGKAIQHLASVDHWKRVKGFMWKYGGGMDRVDSFRISEVDYAKWEKKCKTLKNEASKAEPIGPLFKFSSSNFWYPRPFRMGVEKVRIFRSGVWDGELYKNGSSEIINWSLRANSFDAFMKMVNEVVGVDCPLVVYRFHFIRKDLSPDVAPTISLIPEHSSWHLGNEFADYRVLRKDADEVNGAYDSADD
ncbi:hypothetical protein CASFOL_032708 [Castilleja foliolosa]|uniref:Uncharacterized protein n=1 Tax=Castilleja foliolosa TaxID=1961234 RepID=A0ABD3C2W7_9LAMI